MGVERSVTRWYIQRYSMLNEIALLEVKLAEISAGTAPSNSTLAEKQAQIFLQLAKAREQLVALGPCPKPMMG